MSEDKVGYKNPPRHTRFKPGQTGNPRGRPKADHDLGAALDRIMEEPVMIREGGTARRVSNKEAILLMAYSKAMNGDTKAWGYIASLLKMTKLIERIEPEALKGGVIVVPKGMTCEEWIEQHRIKPKGPPRAMGKRPGS